MDSKALPKGTGVKELRNEVPHVSSDVGPGTVLHESHCKGVQVVSGTAVEEFRSEEPSQHVQVAVRVDSCCRPCCVFEEVGSHYSMS